MRRLLIALTAVLILSTASARAIPPTWATGSFFPAAPPTIVDVRTANGNTIITQVSTFVLVGDLAGVYTGEDRGVQRANGDFEGNGFRTFTGTLNGEPVTLEFRETFQGRGQDIEGRVTTIHGSGVHCQGTYSGGAFTGVGTYALRCH